MGFRKISYLIPSCDGCGLAWSFGELACAEGIPPHFACRAAARAQLATDYGWRVIRLPWGGHMMACRRCAAAGVIPASVRRRLWLVVAGWVRRYVPFGPILRAQPAGHPESLQAVLPAEQEGLLAEIDAELWPPGGEASL
jgi:hypothetical protein